MEKQCIKEEALFEFGDFSKNPKYIKAQMYNVDQESCIKKQKQTYKKLQGWRNSLVSTVPCKHEKTSSVPRTRGFCLQCGGTVVIPVLKRQTQASSWSSLATQPSLLVKFQIKDCPQRKTAPEVILWPAYTVKLIEDIIAKH